MRLQDIYELFVSIVYIFTKQLITKIDSRIVSRLYQYNTFIRNNLSIQILYAINRLSFNSSVRQITCLCTEQIYSCNKNRCTFAVTLDPYINIKQSFTGTRVYIKLYLLYSGQQQLKAACTQSIQNSSYLVQKLQYLSVYLPTRFCHIVRFVPTLRRFSTRQSSISKLMIT